MDFGKKQRELRAFFLRQSLGDITGVLGNDLAEDINHIKFCLALTTGQFLRLDRPEKP